MGDTIVQNSGKKVFVILVAILIFLILLFSVALGKISSNSNIGGKFFGLLDANMAKMYSDMMEFTAKNKATKLNIEIDLEKLNSIFDDSDYSNFEKFNISFANSKDKDKFTSQIMLDYNENTMFDLQMVLEDETIGINLDGVTDGFIALNYTKDGLKKLLNTLNITEEDFEENFGMTLDEMIESLKNKEVKTKSGKSKKTFCYLI